MTTGFRFSPDRPPSEKSNEGNVCAVRELRGKGTMQEIQDYICIEKHTGKIQKKLINTWSLSGGRESEMGEGCVGGKTDHRASLKNHCGVWTLWIYYLFKFFFFFFEKVERRPQLGNLSGKGTKSDRGECLSTELSRGFEFNANEKQNCLSQ